LQRDKWGSTKIDPKTAKNMCVHSPCMGIGMHTALLAFTQLNSITERFKLCWRTGQKLTLKPSFCVTAEWQLLKPKTLFTV